MHERWFHLQGTKELLCITEFTVSNVVIWQTWAEMAEPINLLFGLWTWVGRRKQEFNRIRQMAPLYTILIVFARWRQCTRRHSAVNCARTTEPIDLPFGLWTGVGQGKQKFIIFARWRQCDHMGGHVGATWRIRLNCSSYVKLLRPLDIVCLQCFDAVGWAAEGFGDTCIQRTALRSLVMDEEMTRPVDNFVRWVMLFSFSALTLFLERETVLINCLCQFSVDVPFWNRWRKRIKDESTNQFHPENDRQNGGDCNYIGTGDSEWVHGWLWMNVMPTHPACPEVGDIVILSRLLCLD